MRRLAFSLVSLALATSAMATDWATWRGPNQNGTSGERPYTAELDVEHPLWTLELKGRGTPVIFGERLYVVGYRGDGPDLVEVLSAVNPATGEVLWERTFRDFISDIIYDRYSIGAPTVDPMTGNVYMSTTNGVLMAFTADGDPLWEHSLMEAYGRLSFPNGRTGAVIIEDGLAIVHGITANWGRQGPARDRFYAFDKLDGTPVWASTPGIGPKDSSFSTPVVEQRGGRKVLYAGTGCGNLVAVDVHSGEPVWRAPMSIGGINVSPVIAGDTLIAIHNKENLDSVRMGRMVAFDLNGETTTPEGGGPPVLTTEVWRNDLLAFSSSPVLVDDTVYQVIQTGELVAVDVQSGAERWRLKLAPDQLHASPTWADGLLYVPMHDGSLHVVRPHADHGDLVSSVKLGGSMFGAPAVSGGRVFVHTTERLYALGKALDSTTTTHLGTPLAVPPPSDERTLRIRPNEVLLRSGEAVAFQAELLDGNGTVLGPVEIDSWEGWIPATAKVKASMDASFEGGELVASDDAMWSAGAFKATTADGVTGTIRGRTVPRLPMSEDFEGFERAATAEDGTVFAYPPLPWTGARVKWRIEDVGGDQVLAKTLDRMLFQRSTTFIAHPDESDYVVQADVMTAGTRRQKGDVGVINQRYLITLKGNQRKLEVSSNYERLRQSVAFEIKENTWYRLRTEVQVGDDGVATVRAKAWPRDASEPEGWTLEVTHPDGHGHGAPGLYGFSPQNLHPVFIDNVSVTPRKVIP